MPALAPPLVGATVLPAANGSDDTTALQAVVSGGGKIVGRPGASYIVSSPIKVPSNTHLDMRNCTITLKASSNCNIIQNSAYTVTQRQLTGCAITASSTTLTCSGGAFTSADVGRSIVVAGAGPPAGAQVGPLCALISTVTNSTTVVLSVAAGTTVSSAAASVYDRDENIVVELGIVDRGSNAGSANNANSIVFRRVDGLRVSMLEFSSTAGKFAIQVGDCTHFEVGPVTRMTCASDGVHVNGPATKGVIHSIAGTTADDFVALNCREFPAYEDVCGNISDILVHDLRPTNLTTNVISLYGGPGTTMRSVTIRNIKGSGMKPITVGNGDQSIYQADISDVLIDDVTSDNGASAIVILAGTTLGNIRCRNLSLTASGPDVVQVKGYLGTASVAFLDIDGVSSTGGGSGNGILNVTHTVTTAMIRGVRAEMGSSSNILKLATSAASVTRAFISQVYLTGGGGLVNAPVNGQTLGTVWLTDCYQTTASWIADLATTTTMYLENVNTANAQNGTFNLRATASLTVLGRSGPVNGAVSTTAGYALRVNNPTFTLDISKITSKSAGDTAHNTNGALSCGSGPVISDGSNWKHLYTGSTY